ncbi:hypothetical protein FB561_5644 [Kribbella amoyensis]|uniref:Uncharacterized protein n=1 Tax=Kribbella amoyensis TaxID=996641 RepID=A0A561BZW1_9ACTN|nr:hypothetical protein [Kribbella amoyensis]TWD84456.1 hypothetical protein FB561_5644 [Kribbella amoyensis]
MNTDLEPPPVPRLTEDQHSRLRSRVLTAADPVRRTQRRWVAPVASVAAVGAVVAGTLVVTNRPSEPTPAAPVGVIDKSKIVKTQKDPGVIDLGAATPTETTEAARACQLPGGERTEVLWSRKVAGPAPLKAGLVVLAKQTPGQPGGFYNLGLVAGFPGGVCGAIRDADWNRQPTRTDGLVTLAGAGSIDSPGAGKAALAEYRAIHRVRPEIARIESRYVWPKGHSAWFAGVVQGGFAFTVAAATIPAGQYQPRTDGQSDVRQELRAFDRAGRPVPVTS